MASTSSRHGNNTFEPQRHPPHPSTYPPGPDHSRKMQQSNPLRQTPPATDPPKPAFPEQTQSPKIRLSCDACALAKVKCSKQRPRCERCQQHGMNCVYGISLKYGKGCRKPRRQQQQQQQQQQQRHQQQQDIPFRAPTAPFQVLSADMNMAYSYRDPWQEPGADALESMMGAPSRSANNVPWTANGVSMASNPMSLAPGTMDIMTSPGIDDMSWRGVDGGSTPGFGNNGVDAFVMNGMSGFTGQQPVDFANVAPAMSFAQQLSENHHCYAVAQSTLSALPPDSRHGQTLSMAAGPSAMVQEMPAFGDVLRNTRDAMEILDSLLRCSCAPDPRMITTIAATMTRILHCHQAAAESIRQMTRPHQFTSTPSRSSHSNSSPLHSRSGSVVGASQARPSTSGSSRNSMQSQSMAVDTSPVQIGHYSLDGGDRKATRLMLLLSNLKRLGRLVQSFNALALGIVDPYSVQIHNTLATCLQTELGQVLQEVGSAAKDSNKGWGVT